MSDYGAFTREQLDGLDNEQLKTVCIFYGLDYQSNWKRNRMIEEIWTYYYPVKATEVVIAEPEINVSARIRRIHELNKEIKP